MDLDSSHSGSTGISKNIREKSFLNIKPLLSFWRSSAEAILGSRSKVHLPRLPLPSFSIYFFFPPPCCRAHVENKLSLLGLGLLCRSTEAAPATLASQELHVRTPSWSTLRDTCTSGDMQPEVPSVYHRSNK